MVYLKRSKNGPTLSKIQIFFTNRLIKTRSIWKMLGQFATVSRRMRQSMSTTTTTTTTRDRGDRYGPMEWAQWTNHAGYQAWLSSGCRRPSSHGPLDKAMSGPTRRSWHVQLSFSSRSRSSCIRLWHVKRPAPGSVQRRRQRCRPSIEWPIQIGLQFSEPRLRSSRAIRRKQTGSSVKHQ